MSLVTAFRFLCLSRSGRSSRSSSCDCAIVSLVIDRRNSTLSTWQREVLHGDQCVSAGVSPWSSCLGLLLVGSEVERDEEEEVGAENEHTGDSCEFLASASTGIWHPWEVDACEVSVGGEVDEGEIDDKLGDLHNGDVLLPPDSDATRRLEVVPGFCQHDSLRQAWLVFTSTSQRGPSS